MGTRHQWVKQLHWVLCAVGESIVHWVLYALGPANTGHWVKELLEHPPLVGRQGQIWRLTFAALKRPLCPLHRALCAHTLHFKLCSLHFELHDTKFYI